MIKRIKCETEIQYSLGDLIKDLESIDSPDSRVWFDFCGHFPVDIFSWRGSYDQLAIEHCCGGRNEMTVSAFLELLKSAIDTEFEGYKGGFFKMKERTAIWADEYGVSTCTRIVGLSYSAKDCYLLTEIVDY